MFTLFDAMYGTEWAVALAPLALILGFLGLRELRKLKAKPGEASNRRRDIVGLKGALGVAGLLFVLFLIPWLKCFMTLGFDWDRSDAAEIEVLVFAEPYPLEHSERQVSITDKDMIAQVLQDLQGFRPPGMEGHKNPVGCTYVLRLRRESDGEWSNYSVVLTPDVQHAGESAAVREYEILIYWSGHWLTIYRAPDFGRTVEQLVGEPGDGERDNTGGGETGA